MKVIKTRLPKNLYIQELQELTLDRGKLVRRAQLVILRELQARSVALAHEGHEEIDAMLRNIRDKVWLPHMAYKVKRYMGSWRPCHSTHLPK